MKSISSRITQLEKKSISNSVLYIWRYAGENFESAMSRVGLSLNSHIAQRIFIVSWLNAQTINDH